MFLRAQLNDPEVEPDGDPSCDGLLGQFGDKSASNHHMETLK
jgi:hypothetical protein